MSVTRYLIASVCAGLLFGILDGLINANPLAARLNAYLKPIARERMPVVAAIAIDLAWGFAMAGIFLLLRSALPGQSMPVKGLAFAALAWLFRVLMRAASDAVMLKVSAAATVYAVASGALEMALIGLLLGLVLP